MQDELGNENFNDMWLPLMPNVDGQMDHPKVGLLAGVLKGYALADTVSKIAGLATVPSMQANNYRIEILSLIAVAACAGSKKPNWQSFRTWLNRQLGTPAIAYMEDPVEDVFVVNVVSSLGEFCVLGGLWESGESATTLLYEALTKHGGDEQRAWLGPATALLRLSDAMVTKCGLQRWQMEPSVPKTDMPFAPVTPLDKWGARVIFAETDLAALGIAPADLSHFVFNMDGRSALLEQNNQESELHRRPLLKIAGSYIIALPTAITYAVRWFILSCVQQANQLRTLNAVLAGCVQQRLTQLAGAGSRYSIEKIAIPRELSDPMSSLQSVVMRIGQRRFLHFALQFEDLAQVVSDGFLAVKSPTDSSIRILNSHLEAVQAFVQDRYDLRAGYTILSPAVLGQVYVVVPPKTVPSWLFEVVRLADLEMLLRDPSDPIDRLMLLMHQKNDLELRGFELPNHNGLLNLYAYWKRQGFHLRASDMPHDHPAFVQIGTDYVASYRADRRRTVDEHCELTLSGKPTIVQRTNSESEYQVVVDVPAYVSLAEISKGVLSFCMRHRGAVFWVTLEPPTDKRVNRRIVFELWEALQLFTHRAFSSTFAATSFKFPVAEVVLNFRALCGEDEAIADPSLSKKLTVESASEEGRIVITAGPGFLSNFDGVNNNGERYLVGELLRAIHQLGTDGDEKPHDYSSEASDVLGGTDARVIHTLRYWSPVEFLLASNPERRYRVPTEHIQSSICSAFTWLASTSQTTFLDVEASVVSLNSAVASLVSHLASALHKFNAEAVILELLKRHETLLREKHRWRATARAVRGLYGIADGTDVASRISQEHAQLQISLRALVEASICECNATGGGIPDEFQIDELVGRMVTIIDLGRNSDILYYGMTDKGIRIYANGSYSLDAKLLAQITTPYLTESFGADYAKSSENYEYFAKSHEPEAKENQGDSEYEKPNFLRAWHAEFHLSFQAFIAIAHELQNLAVLKNDVVVEVALDDLKPSPDAYAFSEMDVSAFINSFGLHKRVTWVASPPHSLPKEVNPWRFQRRLSLMLRPVIVVGTPPEKLIFGLGSFCESLAYVLDSIVDGTFDKDVFKSTEMRSYLGSCVDALGREFTELVAMNLRQRGWSTKTELKLTQLSAPKVPDLGDIDILAWKADGNVLVIECKRLKQSKTVAEIALSCKRFSGNVGDHLHKHLRRVDWVMANIPKLAKFTKLSPTTIKVSSPLVVSRPVPFKYLQNLPLSPSDVVSVDNLDHYTSALERLD